MRQICYVLPSLEMTWIATRTHPPSTTTACIYFSRPPAYFYPPISLSIYLSTHYMDRYIRSVLLFTIQFMHWCLSGGADFKDLDEDLPMARRLMKFGKNLSFGSSKLSYKGLTLLPSPLSRISLVYLHIYNPFSHSFQRIPSPCKDMHEQNKAVAPRCAKGGRKSWPISTKSRAGVSGTPRALPQQLFGHRVASISVEFMILLARSGYHQVLMWRKQ